MKRFIISLIFILFSIMSFAYDFEVNGLYFNKLSNSNVEVTYNSEEKYSGEVSIPEKVTYRGIEYAVTGIGHSAFYECSGLTGSLTIPNSVTSIGNTAFSGCNSLNGPLVLSNTVTSIGSFAFSGCSKLEGSLTIPNSVKTIGQYAFLNCSGFTGELTIPSSITVIEKRTFSGCSGLTGSLVIPSSVTSIGDGAFYNCSGLTGSLTLSASIGSIGNEAFYNCSSLIGPLKITDSVTSIGDFAFYGCKSLNGSLVISNSVTCIGNFAFSDCSNLEGPLSIPNSVKTIGQYAFLNCSGFTGELTIPSSITVIEKSTFSGCSGLTGTLVIPSSVTSIGEGAFFNCSGFTGSLVIPNAISKIEDSTFSGCKGFDGSLSIPNTVTSIGNSAFSFCSGFTGSLTIPNSITSIGDKAFQYCSGFNGSLTIPNSVASIGNSAFYSCKGFTGSLIIPNSITSIGDKAFQYCSGFNGSLTIPNSVTSIGGGAFGSCRSVENVISEIEIPFEIGTTVFSSVSSNAILRVPIGTKSSYEKFTGWTEHFAKVLEIGEEISISIKAEGYGFAQFGTSTIKNQTKSFSIDYGKSATIGFWPDNGYKIGSVKLNNKDITSEIVDYQYTIKKIEDNTSIVVTFESISGTLYGLSISANGNGYAEYNGSITREDANSYIVKAGTSPQISFTPDDGYRIAKVLENSVDVTSKVFSKRYSVSNINKNTLISVWFEENPITTYTLIIKTTGNGSVVYDDTTWKNETKSFTVNEGTNATIAISPESGYRLKSILVDSKDVTSEVSNNFYTVGNINKDTSVEVEFEAIPIPAYTLTITATGNGNATYTTATIRNKTQKFTLNEGTNVVVTFNPDNGNSIKSVKVNEADITASISGNRYVIEGITANMSIEVTFVEDINALTVDGVNYSVISQSEKTIKLMGGNIGQVLTVPATITQNETTWKVTDIDKEALKNNSELAAIIWNPEVAFTATVSNPNLLLYVKDEQYAPEGIRNVVVNGFANEIALFDAASGNGFYCPQAFTALVIVYAHRYSMETGVGTSKGWETITLPFDVQSINHQTKGAIKPFATWKEGDTSKPFWLYELTGNGFVKAEGIKAYTPYIISMPYNPKYNEEWQLNGEVKFSAYNVTIESTDDLKTASFKDRTFIPNFIDKAANEGFFGLNVVNDYSSNNSGMIEGSKFVLNMRQIHPFEAYMTTTSNSRHAIGIFDDMTTAIHEIETKMEAEQDAVFDLQGRRMNVPRKGVYIKNGKKYIKK